MKFKLIFAVMMAIGFVGCAGALNDTPSTIRWVKYLENDGLVQEMSFYKRASISQNSKKGDYLGEAVMKINGADGSWTQAKIGELFSVGGNDSLIIQNIDEGTSVFINSKDDMEALYHSKNIKFYAIGGGIIQTIFYSADSSVCAEFDGGRSVKTRSVTNYMNGDEFFAVIALSTMAKNGYELDNLEYRFYVNEKDRAFMEVEAKSENFRVTIQEDLKKQQRILDKMICRSDFN